MKKLGDNNWNIRIVVRNSYRCYNDSEYYGTYPNRKAARKAFKELKAVAKRISRES